jgi:hypothetical protein
MDPAPLDRVRLEIGGQLVPRNIDEVDLERGIGVA